MSRAAASVNVISKNLTKDERRIRQETENKLKGNSNKIKAFSYLTPAQKKIFKFIANELAASGILSNLDVHILNRCAVAADRINTLDSMANDDSELLIDTKFLKSRREYTDDYNKCCQELCLSPQARAKIGTLSINKKDKNPLIGILHDD